MIRTYTHKAHDLTCKLQFLCCGDVVKLSPADKVSVRIVSTSGAHPTCNVSTVFKTEQDLVHLRCEGQLPAGHYDIEVDLQIWGRVLHQRAPFAEVMTDTDTRGEQNTDDYTVKVPILLTEDFAQIPSGKVFSRPFDDIIITR